MEKGVTERFQDEQIRNVPLSSLALVCGNDGYVNLPSLHAFLIFRIEPKIDSNDEQSQVILASSYVMDKLAERYLNGTTAELLQFAATIQKSGRLSELRGRLLEGALHRAINKRSVVFNRMSVFLLDPNKIPTPLRTNVPSMQFETVNEFVDIVGIPLEQLCKGSYFHAKRTNEATTIEAFALVEEAFVKQQFPNHPALTVATLDVRSIVTTSCLSCSFKPRWRINTLSMQTYFSTAKRISEKDSDCHSFPWCFVSLAGLEGSLNNNR